MAHLQGWGVPGFRGLCVLDHADILITTSQEGYARFAPTLKPKGTLIVEQDLVTPSEDGPGGGVFGTPATRRAEEVGRRLVLNAVVVGFTVALTGIITADAARKAIRDSVSRSMEGLNLEAFGKGWGFGVEVTRSGAARRCG